MFFAKIVNRLILPIKHFDSCWHKTTNNNKFISTRMPWEIMYGSIFSFDWTYFIFSIIVDKKTKLSIIWFAWWIKICLKFHQKLIGIWTESYLYLFCFLYIFVVYWFLCRFFSEDVTYSFVCFFVQVYYHNKVFISFTCLWHIKKLQRPTLNILHFLMLSIIYFNYFVVIAEIPWPITWKTNQWKSVS